LLSPTRNGSGLFPASPPGPPSWGLGGSVVRLLPLYPGRCYLLSTPPITLTGHPSPPSLNLPHLFFLLVPPCSTFLVGLAFTSDPSKGEKDFHGGTLIPSLARTVGGRECRSPTPVDHHQCRQLSPIEIKTRPDPFE